MDLRTRYLGLDLKTPIVPSSSPLTREIGNLRYMEDLGAGAIVLYSLFEEEINRESHLIDHYLTQGAESYAEALSYFPEATDYRGAGPDGYLNHIRRAKESLEIPIIASLNGVSSGGWIHYARDIEKAGADALELNIYYLPTDPNLGSSEVEAIYLDVLADIKKTVSIPVAMKLSPYFSATANMAQKLAAGGVDGLVLFNRFYQPDLDLDALEVVPNLVLSRSDELRLPLRWIAILYGRVPVDLALTTGVHTGEDALKGIAAGAAIVMMASELLRNGPSRIRYVINEMATWLETHEYASLDELRGSLSQINCPAPAAFERANYIRVVGSSTF